jgi:nucleotide-binding universal stress UspA family protein
MKAQVLDTTAALHVKNIVYATDLSFAAERALPYAHEIARRYGATLHVVHAIQPDVYPLVPPTEWPKVAKDEEIFREESKAELEAQLEDVDHKLIFKRGKVAGVLNEVIEKEKTDLLVMSTHGRTGIRKALVGSVAEEMFRHATCPVLTVGPVVTAKPREAGELNKILYATDFRLESLGAAPFAMSLAHEHRAQLILLHCLGRSGEDMDDMRRRLADLVPFGLELRTEPDCIVEHGQPAAKILEIAESHGADLIVLGIHGTRAESNRHLPFLHPAVLRIVTEAKCPVLTVRS